MIRLKRFYSYDDDTQEGVLVPMRGQWYFVQEGEHDLIVCYRSWEKLQAALYDLVDLEGWEVLT